MDLAAENAALKTRVAELEQQLTKLTDQLATLREELSRNSTNSNLPPSSDGPGKSRNQRKAERRERKGKKRGGQKGHKGSHRELLPPEQVAEFVDLYPGRCASCWESLPKIFDALPKRHQCTELEPGGARTTEYRRHAVVCPGCGHKTRADFDDDVIPRYAFGPKLMSAVVLLTGVYHLSRRRAVGVLRDLLGVRISLGAVSAIEKRLSDAVEPAVDEAWAKARSAEVKHTDGTTWLRAGVMVSLWTIATAAATVFKVVDNGRKETLAALFEVQRGVLVSDRATALKFWDMKRRQVCWNARCTADSAARRLAAMCSCTSFSILLLSSSCVVVMRSESHVAAASSNGGLNGYPSAAHRRAVASAPAMGSPSSAVGPPSMGTTVSAVPCRCSTDVDWGGVHNGVEGRQHERPLRPPRLSCRPFYEIRPYHVGGALPGGWTEQTFRAYRGLPQQEVT